ncbi:light-harvesting antenna LH1, beta subunit [Pseudahrensia aquimaris]|uniref:Light-harvesting antenna LH1, beta subunit n=1 Tax=Pseudahrensia aquimaris TaxID=744461 RepID=A0ABW3FIM6_9HYPH
MAASETASATGMTSGEAREFHRIFMKSTIAFTGWAFAAHVLVHMWRPWMFQDATAQSSMMDGINSLTSIVTAMV